MIYAIAKDIAAFSLTLTGLIVAGKGLSTWRRQIKGNKEFEVAYNLNYAVLKVRDAIKHVRNPAIWNAETDRAKEHFKSKYPDRQENIEENANRYVYQLRWEKITSAFTEVESHLLAAEVLWGAELADKVKPLNNAISKLNLNLLKLVDPQFRTEKNDGYFDIVYNKSTDEKKDEFTLEVDLAVSTMTDFLKPKLK